MISVYGEADSFSSLDSISVNPFLGTGPVGITLHYTADDDIERVKRQMKESIIGYHIIISKDGRVHQTSRLDRTVNHAGRALWQKQSPNRAHIAIAIISWGRLDSNKKSWNGTLCPDAIYRNGFWWDSATQEQEEKVLFLCKYFRNKMRLPVDSICGHDECALPAGRKIDPGHIMSFDMEQLRKKVWP